MCFSERGIDSHTCNVMMITVRVEEFLSGVKRYFFFERKQSSGGRGGLRGAATAFYRRFVISKLMDGYRLYPSTGQLG